MCSPPFFVSFEKAADRLPRPPERLRPAVEQAPALVGELVGPLGGPRKVGAPLGADGTFVLERPQEAVEVADVHAALDPELRDPLEQLVSVERPLAQEQEQRRLDEPLDAGADGPVPGPDEPAAAGSWVGSMPHRRQYR